MLFPDGENKSLLSSSADQLMHTITCMGPNVYPAHGAFYAAREQLCQSIWFMTTTFNAATQTPHSCFNFQPNFTFK